MQRAALSAIILCSLVPGNFASGQTNPDRYRQKLQPVLEDLIQRQALPGFAIAVVEDGKLTYSAGFGVRNVKAKNDPVTPRTLFHIASITKTFVGTSLMQLAEQGKLNLDARVVTYLP